jgi:FkbM family methyltransferase
MSKYVLEQSRKTKAFNFFRRFFATPGIEKIIIRKVSKSGPATRWAKVIPPNYLYKKESIRKVNRNNINLILDISNVVDHFIYFGYTEPVFDSVLEDVRKAKTIFDVGGNIGFTAMYFSTLNSTACIFAFEPHPKTFQRAQDNLSVNNFKNIYFQKLGLGDKPDTVKLFEVNSNNPGMNRIIPGNNDFPHVTIEIDTIDNFVQVKGIEKIDFMKIDVEGFELSVLKGAAKTFQKQLPILFIELDDDNLRENNSSAKELVELLSSYGYKKIYRADKNEPVTGNTDFTHCHYDIIARKN